MIEIVSIGAELLTGQTINTNASRIAALLLEKGFSVKRVVTVTDEKKAIQEAVSEALERASIVITTGGLGPTGDDITRSSLAELFKAPIIRDETVAIELQKRYGKTIQTLEDQALVIKGAEVLHNPVGTAPGFILKKGEKPVIVLPGVPLQMERLLQDQVLPYLMKSFSPHHFHHALFLALLSEQDVDPMLRELEKQYPQVSIGICPSYGTLSIYLHTKAEDRPKAEKIFEPILDALRKKWSTYIFSETDRRIEKALHELLIERQQTLACAESCTGGKMAARLTAISGSSTYFLGSLVTYSNALKIATLGVRAETLQATGAVSRETVEEMTNGTLKLSHADFVLAVSGIAGPSGGSEEKPVGTVWGGIGIKEDKIYKTCFSTKGKNPSRSVVIEYATTFLFANLWRYLQHGISPFEAT